MDEQFDDLPLFSQGGPRAEVDRGSQSVLNASSSLSAAINAWGKALEGQGRSIHTVKAFTGDLRLVAKYLGGGQPLQQVSTSDLKNFLDWMLNHRGVPCSPKTYARRITSIKSFYRWLVEAGILTKDPADPIPQQSVISPLPEVLTREEVERVVEAAGAARQAEPPDARPFTLLTLLLETGIKKGECLNIHLNNIDLEAAEGPLLYVRYGRVSKRYKERKLSLSGEWVAAYREYVRQYTPDDRLFPWSPRRLEYLLEEIGETAGIEKHISFDMCRWTSALLDTLDGVEADKIRQKLGISKIQWREVGNKLGRLADQVVE